MVLKIAYCGGLRRNEISRLKLVDIDSKNYLIRIENSKGNKDRYTLLAKSLVPELREYYKKYKPQKYLFPVKALGKVFRGKFTDGLNDLHNKGDIQLDRSFVPGKKYLHPLYKNKWVVYAKLPMNNPMQVVNYIGRYSHRIAISNHRIKAVENGRVKFSWVDYRTSKSGILNITGEEFLQRFSLHVLPFGFMKIRHYGILSSRNKATALACACKSLNADPSPAKTMGNSSAEWLEELFGNKALICPVCKKGTMKLIAVVWPRARGSPLKFESKGFAG
jgi:hypothetical protein